MNDFTKDELELIRDALDLWNTKNFCSDMKSVSLKVYSMIASYCEHHEYGEIEIFVDVCGKCDALMLGDKTLREYNE